MIICFVTQTPLFLCGKPGSSKSLSLSLVLKNFNGKSSKSKLLRRMPEFRQLFYQCSEYSTSEGFERIFNKAESFAKRKEFENSIIVLIFEEIGLAELSPNNPLKVLHSRLEIEEVNYAFIGISNWRIDSSKMNRTLYLGRPDPIQSDLQSIIHSLYKNYNKNNKEKKMNLQILK